MQRFRYASLIWIVICIDWFRTLPIVEQRQFPRCNGRVNILLLLGEPVVKLLITQYELIIGLPQYVPPMTEIVSFIALPFFDLVDKSLNYFIGSSDIIGLGLRLPASYWTLVIS